mgnify:CR=1 FL=1
MKIIAQYLKTNNYVEELDLSNNNVRYVHVSCSFLPFFQIGDDGLKYLCQALLKNKKLTHLELHHCNISDAGVQDLSTALKLNLSVTSINLSSNRITDIGLGVLARQVRLSSPSSARVGFGVVELMCMHTQQIGVTNRVEHLSCKYNSIGDSVSCDTV